jgi:protein arginine N-methyltransferase 1
VSTDLLAEHLGYVSDSARLQRFSSAISAVVRPGDRVADLGCGSGILGLLCLRAGASHVYAVDESSMIDLARETMARCGLSDRVTFLHGRSQALSLPEKVDVVVCDHIGGFGFDYSIMELLRDANRRFLKPGGTCIPANIRLHVAPVESQGCYDLANAWSAAEVPPEFHWVRERLVNSRHLVALKESELLGISRELGSVTPSTEKPDYLSWKTALQIHRSGVMHGLGGWFDATLAPGIGMTNSPLSEHRIDRVQAFLPIEEAVVVEPGEHVQVQLMARPDDALIAWDVAFPRTGKLFRQSTWASMSLSPERLRNSSASRVPRLSREGRARSTVLGYCDGRRTAQEIEDAILREHPNLLPTKAEICRLVTSVLARDTTSE